jgi:tight adherence protein B
MFIGVFLATAAILTLVHRRSRDEKATLARIDSLISSGEAIADEDPILIELQRKKTWLQALIGETSIARHIALFLDQAAWVLTVDTFLLWCLGAGFAGFVLSWLLAPNPLNEIALFCAFALVPYLLLRFRRAKRLSAFDKALPEAMDIMQRTLKAGLALNEAFKRASEKAREPVGGEFRTVINRMQRGADLRSELIKLAERVPTADLRIFVTAMLVQSDTGGNLPLILERLTDMIRARILLLSEMSAETAQGRLSGVFMALIPVFLMGALRIINPIYMQPLFHDPRGKIMLIYAIASDIVGSFIIHLITTMEV